MSVALDLESFAGPYAPCPSRPRLRLVPREAPAQAHPQARPQVLPLASVSVLNAPSPSAVAAPLRLTRRGVAVLAVLTAAVGAVLVWTAAASAGGAPTPPAVRGPAVVTVQPGDTLWALASRVAPSRDPRAEVAQLRQLNHLADPAITPGQTLRVR